MHHNERSKVKRLSAKFLPAAQDPKNREKCNPSAKNGGMKVLNNSNGKRATPTCCHPEQLNLEKKAYIALLFSSCSLWCPAYVSCICYISFIFVYDRKSLKDTFRGGAVVLMT